MTRRRRLPKSFAPDRMPSSLAERRAWLAAAGRETDDQRILAALRTVRDPDAAPEDRDAACAVLWRTIKPLIEVTTIRLSRITGASAYAGEGRTRDAGFETVDMAVTDLIVGTRSTTVGGFITYAQHYLSHLTGRTVVRDQRGRRFFPLGVVRHEELEATYDGEDPDFVEQLLMEGIKYTTRRLPHHTTLLMHHFGLGEFRGRPLTTTPELRALYRITPQRLAQLVDAIRVYVQAAVGDREGKRLTREKKRRERAARIFYQKTTRKSPAV